MPGFSSISFGSFKSPLRCLGRWLFISRNRWRERAKHWQAECNRSCRELQEMRRDLQRLEESNRLLTEQLHRAAASSPDSEPNRAPNWKNLPGHQFSPEMIALCCHLQLLVGVRAVPKVLECFANAFDLRIKIPSRDAVRNWSCRNGVAILQEATRQADWVWMIDHSIQLGKMFVLVVLGIRQSELPVDRALRREDMTVLAVMPTTFRDKHEVARQLATVAAQYGAPLAVLSDGATELHEGVRLAKNEEFAPAHLDDIKHKIANILKKLLRGCERWKAFSAKVGSTTAAIQQTELEHLLPPRKKEKGRFMDFGRLIDWANMIEHQLTQTTSPDHERIVEKLGWILEFKTDLILWRQYRHLIGESLEMANEQGVFAGASEQLRERLSACDVASEPAREFGERIVSCYAHNEAQLKRLKRAGLRLPCSTEVLESAFGSFKALQGNHGRGTFTSLLSVFANQFDHCTAAKIRERFARVSNQDVKAWLRDSGLTNSTQSRRAKAYAQARPPETEFTAS